MGSSNSLAEDIESVRDQYPNALVAESNLPFLGYGVAIEHGRSPEEIVSYEDLLSFVRTLSNKCEEGRYLVLKYDTWGGGPDGVKGVVICRGRERDEDRIEKVDDDSDRGFLSLLAAFGLIQRDVYFAPLDDCRDDIWKPISEYRH